MGAALAEAAAAAAAGERADGAVAVVDEAMVARGRPSLQADRRPDLARRGGSIREAARRLGRRPSRVSRCSVSWSDRGLGSRGVGPRTGCRGCCWRRPGFASPVHGCLGRRQRPPADPSWNAYTIVGLPTDALLAVALGLFARARSSGPDRRSLVDAVTVTAGLVMLVWLFRILPTLTDPALSGRRSSPPPATPRPDRRPAGARAAARPRHRVGLAGPAGYLGTVCGLVSGVIFGLLRLHLAYWWLVDLGMIAGLALCGAAAMHPAMREMTRHAARPYETSRARLVVLTVASFAAPLLLILQGHNDTRDAVIAVSAALLWLLAQARLWEFNVSQLRTLTWERALTAAGPALASAASVEEVAAALRTAADTVSGPRSGYAAVFATRISGELRVLMTSSAGAAAEPACGDCAALAAVGAAAARRPHRGDRPAPLYVPAAELESSAGISDLGPGGDGVLVCPIFLSTDPPGEPPAGILALIGGQRNLEVRWPSVQILVSEAGLAMERTLLTQQRVKRESEELFKELVQDASDAILIIDDDDTVRYASPSATAIFGDVPIVGADIAASWRPPPTSEGTHDSTVQAPPTAGRAISASSGGSFVTTGRSCACGSGAATCAPGRASRAGC